MSEEFDLVAELREDQGKGASRRLRRENKVPAIIYGAGRPPRMLAFDHDKVLQELDNESFYSSILNIQVNDKSQAAVVKDIQRHPAKRQIMHMDFQRIVEGEAIRMNVPLHFLGEDDAPGLNEEGGTISRQMNDVEVSCLPKDLPEYIEVDVSKLEVNDSIHMSEIPLPKGVEIPELAQGPENDRLVVSLQIVHMAPVEEEETDEEVSAEVPLVDEDSGEGDGDSGGEGDDKES